VKSWGPRRAPKLVAVLLISLLGFAGCSDDDDASTDDAAAGSSSLISKEIVDEFEPETPERTVVEWLRYVQFLNAPGALRFYRDDAAPGEDVLARQIDLASPALRGVPTVEGVDQEGREATVFIRIDPGGDLEPRAFSANLVEVGDGWKLADNSFLEQAVAAAPPPQSLPQDPKSGSQEDGGVPPNIVSP